ncbi:MAG TPA: hypothetical protein VK939_11945 [Longimicrobiales bacterium]|nr:hypothetical protein [Longimicrobiales bacterium]
MRRRCPTRATLPPLRLLLALLACAWPSALAAQTAEAAADSAWRSGDRERAYVLYNELLAGDSTHTVALHRTALVHASAGRYRESLHLLDRLLALQPDDRAAAMTRATVLLWRGDLIAAEVEWRALHEQDRADQLALAGLARTLRWQGRDAAARELLMRGRPPLPDELEVGEEMRRNRVALRPHALPALWHERDSDRARITTLRSEFAWRPEPRLQLGVDGYVRRARRGATAARAQGAALTAWRQREPGWALRAALGGSVSDVADAAPFLIAAIGAETPLRERFGGTLDVRTGAFDVTGPLIENQVRITEAALAGWIRGVGWRLDANASLAELYARASRQDNLRTGASLAFMTPLSALVTVGARLHTFGFDDELADGYFSPERYSLAELVVRGGGEVDHWSLSGDGAAGAQRVNGGALTGSWRGSGRFAFRLAPGREVALLLNAARSGLESVSPDGDAPGHSYLAAGLSMTWTF